MNKKSSDASTFKVRTDVKNLKRKRDSSSDIYTVKDESEIYVKIPRLKGGRSNDIYTVKDKLGTDVKKPRLKEDSLSDIFSAKDDVETDVNKSRRKLGAHTQSSIRKDYATTHETSMGEKTIDSKNDEKSRRIKQLAQTIQKIRMIKKEKYTDSSKRKTLSSATKSLSESGSSTNAKHTIKHIHSTYDLYTRDIYTRDAGKKSKLPKDEEKIKAESRNGISTSPKPSLVSGFDAWEGCLYQTDFKQRAKDLLKKGKLPEKRLLETICSIYKRQSNVVQMICHHICSYLRTLSDSIIHIWPAYRYDKGQSDLSNENEIIFVLITRQNIELTTEFNTYQRCILDISPQCKKENNDIKEQEAKSKLPDQVAEDLKECLRTNAKPLMKDHSNLNRVSLSWIKGSGYADESSSLEKSPCIALYVHVKGLVPLSEDPFDETIQKFDVDVREGVFELCGPANDFHQNVKMGCAMDSGYGTNQGTVGPFVRYEKDSHMYYITSAHVVLDSEQMQRLIDKKYIIFGELGSDTFQPPESESAVTNMRHPLGKTELAVYKKGHGTEAGVEIALVRIKDDRIPLDGTFPDSYSSEFSDDKPFVFPTGQVSDKTNLSQSVAVYKYGCASGLTKGICRLNGDSSVRTNALQSTYLGLNIELHGQIEIDSVDIQVPFGKEGDSGSLVLTKQGETLVAVGIFEGKMGDTFFVTPINDILQELSELLSRYKKPSKQSDTEMDIEELYSPMAINIKYLEPRHITGPQLDTNNAITEGARAQQDLETNIAHFTEHKINSMKTELTIIKNELVQKMNQIEDNVTKNISQEIENLKNFFRGQNQIDSLTPNN